MDERKLIIPAEVKVCATCSYWDGERRVDEEIGVVVVSESCEGECLVKESKRACLHDVRQECNCLWEDLRPDVVGDDAEPASESESTSAGADANSATPPSPAKLR